MLLTRKGAIPVVADVVFVLYTHTISLKLRGVFSYQTWETWGFRTFVSRFILGGRQGGKAGIYWYLSCSPRVVLFISVWLWACSACCRPSIWRQPATSIWPEPRVQPAKRSQFWIAVDNVVFSWHSACSSCLRLSDEQYSALCVWTASNPTAWFWLWYPQCWWVPNIFGLFPFGLKDYVCIISFFIKCTLNCMEKEDFCLVCIFKCKNCPP